MVSVHALMPNHNCLGISHAFVSSHISILEGIYSQLLGYLVLYSSLRPQLSRSELDNRPPIYANQFFSSFQELNWVTKKLIVR